MKRKDLIKTGIQCLSSAQAELISLGGAVVLSICMLMTVMLIIALQSAGVSAAQRAVMVGLTGASWLYFLDSVTERLRLFDHTLEYSAFLSRRRLISLDDLETIVFVHEGFNLERGIESFEFRRRDGAGPDRLSLGPCWQRNKLEIFLQTVAQTVKVSNLVKEVR